MTLNDSNFETDALAAYCQNDSVEFIMIANKEANKTLIHSFSSTYRNTTIPNNKLLNLLK